MGGNDGDEMVGERKPVFMGGLDVGVAIEGVDGAEASTGNDGDETGGERSPEIGFGPVGRGGNDGDEADGERRPVFCVGIFLGGADAVSGGVTAKFGLKGAIKAACSTEDILSHYNKG